MSVHFSLDFLMNNKFNVAPGLLEAGEWPRSDLTQRAGGFAKPREAPASLGYTRSRSGVAPLSRSLDTRKRLLPISRRAHVFSVVSIHSIQLYNPPESAGNAFTRITTSFSHVQDRPSLLSSNHLVHMLLTRQLFHFRTFILSRKVEYTPTIKLRRNNSMLFFPHCAMITLKN